MELSSLKSWPGAKKKTRRRGRGIGSARGRYSGRGNKGAKSRSGTTYHLFFEGGQTPLVRRLPKVGFTSLSKKEYDIVNLEIIEKKYKENETVSPETLKEKGLADGKCAIKILAKGELKKALNFSGTALSQSAREKILSAGGKIDA